MADSDITIPVTGTGDSGPIKVDTRTVGSSEHRQVIVVGAPDSTDTVDVFSLTNANVLPVAMVNASGDQVTTFGGTGGTASDDGDEFTT